MNRISAFNDWLGLTITRAVGTMWCAYTFAALALLNLPQAVQAGTAALVAWTAQTFLQLVLLSIILVGQDLLGKATDARLTETHDAVIESREMHRQELALLREEQGAMRQLVVEMHTGTHTPTPTKETS